MANQASTPFDNNDKFKALSPEAQQIVLQKFGSLSPEAQTIVSSKLNSSQLPSDVVNEPGLQDISLTPLTKGEFQKTGEDIATGLASKGFNPHLSAAAGTAFAMIPHVATSLVGPKGAKTAGEAVTSAGEAISTAGKTIAESSVGKALQNTGAKEVGALTEKLAQLPLNQAAKRTAVQGLKQEAGIAIGEAEKGLNIGMSQTSADSMRRITSDKDLLAKFADRASQLADKGADKLAEISSPETLQFYRKTAQQGIKTAGNSIGDIARNKLFQINKVFGDALSLTDKPFGEAMGRFKDVEAVIKDLPDSFTKEKQILKLALAKAKNSAMSQAALRKKMGYIAGAVGTGIAAEKVFGK